MRTDELMEAIGGIDDRYIESASKKRKSRLIYILLPAAACICAAVGLSAYLQNGASDIAADTATEPVDTITAPVPVIPFEDTVSIDAPISANTFVFNWNGRKRTLSNYGYASYKRFEDIMGKSGIIVTTSGRIDGTGVFCDRYYIYEDGDIHLIAQNTGIRESTLLETAWQKDINDDGVMELITNNTYLTDPHTGFVAVYSLRDGHMLEGIIDEYPDEFQGLPKESISTEYLPETEQVRFTSGGEAWDDVSEEQESPLTDRMLLYHEIGDEYLASVPGENAVLASYGDVTVQSMISEEYGEQYVLCYKDSKKAISWYGHAEIMPFSGILGYRGVSVICTTGDITRTTVDSANIQTPYSVEYYGIKDDQLIYIGSNYGIGTTGDHYSYHVDTRDIDGDGIRELISENVYSADGGTNIYIYKRSGSTVYMGEIDREGYGIPIYASLYTSYDKEKGEMEILWTDDNDEEHSVTVGIEELMIKYHRCYAANNRYYVASTQGGEWLIDRDMFDDSGLYTLHHTEIGYDGKIDFDSDDPADNSLHGIYELRDDQGAVPTLTAFDDVMGVDGVKVEFRSYTGGDVHKDEYYFTADGGKVVCIAQAHYSCDRELEDISPNVVTVDTDGDGTNELLTVNEDENGKYSVVIYRFRDGTAYAGRMKVPSGAEELPPDFEPRFVREDGALRRYMHDPVTDEGIVIDVTDENIEYSPLG
ncbi:MAG: hypothetical protein J6M90_03485 [Oscillospiraceae bacterium]|nr:hypothetical protein [Oscillospiraceae bacterium]